MDGEVVEVNGDLSSQPNLVNQSPEEQGWLLKLKFRGTFADLTKSWKDAVAYKDSLQH